MKMRIVIIAILSGAVFSGGCSKSNELVPPNKNVIRDYVLPPASFMTPDERTAIEERRQEYERIL